MIKGLLKKKSLFSTTYEPNMGKDKKEKLIDGIIYKTKPNTSPQVKAEDFEKFTALKDMEFQLAEISGSAIDKPVIQNVSYSDWAGVHFADPIP